jgi:hypothetical protein
MSVNQDFKDLFRILKDCEVRYLVAGAYAVIYHTEPRYTKDLDIWVEPTPENAEKVWKALKIFGAPLRDISVKNFCDKELVYQIGVAPNRIDVMMDIPGVSFSGAWKNRVKTTYDNEPANIIGIEDLIQAKKTSNRDQDRLDLRNLQLKRESKP